MVPGGRSWMDIKILIDFQQLGTTIQHFGLSERSHINMAQKLTPLHDRILVRRIDEGETVRGGIIIPDTAKEKPQEGEVIAVGKGKKNEEGKVFPLDVQDGDRILFGKYAGTEIKIDNEEFLIMREEEVLGVLSGAAKSVKKAS
jgi:chaperonin GroES